ncbi:MAG: hypothetical protein D6705_00290 [Deltaproteobacteria bacterium]|nr:MAG: hypothetical protein D6705_00290 [Deltaproteobacteria bacterium]
MASILALTAAVVLGVGAFAHTDESPEVPDAKEPATSHIVLAGDILPSVVSAAVRLDLATPGLVSGGGGRQTVDASLRVEGSVVHPFEGGVQNVSLALALFPRDEAQTVLARITADPLALSDDELHAPLPTPIAVVLPPISLADDVPPGVSVSVDTTTHVGPIEIAPHAPLGFVATMTGYDLVDPTPGDVLRIFEEGGAADHAAVARWMNADGAPWGEGVADTEAVVAAALDRACRLRGPPRHGDFQRAHAYLATLERLIGPRHTERFLECRRRIDFLLTGIALSYPEALRMERALGLPVDEMERMPAVSNFLGLTEATARTLRYRAPARLLELAYDPIDFPAAPKSVHPSPLRRPARHVLAPLAPTDVGPMLELVHDDLQASREVFAFYIRMGHEPVVEHLVPWLLEHREFSADLGKTAARRFPAPMTDRLFEAYVDATDPKDRAFVAEMLRWLPDRGRDRLAELLMEREAIAVPEGASLEDLLRIHHQALRARADHEAEKMLAYILDGPRDLVAVPQRIRTVERLVDVAPEHARDHAAAIVDFLARAAWMVAADAPAESDLAVALLASDVWPDRLARRAATAAAVVRARILARAGDLEAGLAHLRATDEHLATPDIRELYETLMVQAIDARLDHGDGARAAGLLDDFRVRTNTPDAFPDLERKIFLRRYWPALVLGGLFVVSLLGTLVVLGMRFARTRLLPYLERRRRIRRMMYDVEDLLADDDAAADDTFLALESDCTGLGEGAGLLGSAAAVVDFTVPSTSSEHLVADFDGGTDHGAAKGAPMPDADGEHGASEPGERPPIPEPAIASDRPDLPADPRVEVDAEDSASAPPAAAPRPGADEIGADEDGRVLDGHERTAGSAAPPSTLRLDDLDLDVDDGHDWDEDFGESSGFDDAGATAVAGPAEPTGPVPSTPDGVEPSAREEAHGPTADHGGDRRPEAGTAVDGTEADALLDAFDDALAMLTEMPRRVGT